MLRQSAARTDALLNRERSPEGVEVGQCLQTLDPCSASLQPRDCWREAFCELPHLQTDLCKLFSRFGARDYACPCIDVQRQAIQQSRTNCNNQFRAPGADHAARRSIKPSIERFCPRNEAPRQVQGQPTDCRRGGHLLAEEVGCARRCRLLRYGVVGLLDVDQVFQLQDVRITDLDVLSGGTQQVKDVVHDKLVFAAVFRRACEQLRLTKLLELVDRPRPGNRLGPDVAAAYPAQSLRRQRDERMPLHRLQEEEVVPLVGAAHHLPEKAHSVQ
mmetsp:Transcript_54372/g.126589  ORF Transcript_54372/g.126589 Transcript_54372/m.126589 type:complete len:273 (+) Transcript_54372:36-854(+)